MSSETLAADRLQDTDSLLCPGPNLVVFDGLCPLCHRFVRLLLNADRGGSLCFAPLEGATARRLAKRYRFDEEQPTVVYLRGFGTDEERVCYRSDAILAAVTDLGGPWSAMALARIVPRPLRDAAYNAVAARRSRWFGRFDQCPSPAPEQRRRFLP